VNRHRADTARGDPRPRPEVRAAAPNRPAVGERWEVCGFGTQVAVLTGRSLRTAFGDYRLVFFGLLQPVVMLLLFSQVFSRIGTLPEVVQYRGYINFLMPATLINIAVTTAMSSGVGVLAEIYTGFIGRLRVMPISMFAVLVARTLSDALRLAVQLTVAVLAAVVFLDFRPAGFAGVATALGLAVLVGWGLGWLFVAIATWQRKAETMQAISFIVMFPLMFGSSAYMPVAAMPGWLRVLSTVNPLTYAINATRALTAGAPAVSALATAVGIVVALAVLGAAGAARNFRRAR
jgi:ABC-2 type transport system permease protein